MGEGKKGRKGEKGAFIKNTEGLSLERTVFALGKSCKGRLKLQGSFAINEQNQGHFTSSARISKCFTSTQLIEPAHKENTTAGQPEVLK